MESSEKFDGNLVFVVNNDDIENGRYHFYNEKLGRFAPISTRLLRALSTKRSLIIPSFEGGISCADEITLKACKDHNQRLERRVSQERKKSGKLKNPEIYEILEHGRIKISLLLNSPGGQNKQVVIIRQIAEYFKSKGGEVYSFGGTDVHSGAAHLFMLANRSNRFLSKTGTLMFHLSDQASDNSVWETMAEAIAYALEMGVEDAESMFIEPNAMEKQRKAEIQELSALLLGNVANEYRDLMRRTLENAFNNPDPENPDCPLYISADQANILGLAKSSDIRKEFENFNGLGGEVYKNTKIDDFFCQNDAKLIRALRAIMADGFFL